jgi:ribonuclease HII
VTAADGQFGLPMFANEGAAGVDEAGRGPLAGPVVAAAVLLAPGRAVRGLADSKVLSDAARRDTAMRVLDGALAWSVAWADPAEIDSLNILNATLLAMRRAVEGLALRPRHVLVDGNRCPRLDCTVEAIVRGDASVPSISAASILAKVCRDDMMSGLDEIYPGYGFSSHKGYPTRQHVAALEKLGPSPVHRRTFGPVARVVDRA